MQFSLDFSAFGPSVRVEPRSKVVLRVGTGVGGVSKTPRGEGLLLLSYFRF